MSALLTLNGTDLIVGVTPVDEDGNSITAGETIKFNIQRRSDSKWWDTTTLAFDLAAEPTLIAAAQVGSTGIYELTLTAGYDGSCSNYTVHINATGVLAQDFYVNDVMVISQAVETILTSITELSSDLEDVPGDLTLIKKLVKYIHGVVEKLLSRTNLPNDRNLNQDANYRLRQGGRNGLGKRY